MHVYSDPVNMVNAPFLAKARGLDVREVRHDREGDYHTLVRVTATTPDGPKSVAGPLFGNAKPRLAEMPGMGIETELSGEMLYIATTDAPVFTGRLGPPHGEAGVQNGTFPPGRRGP